MHWRQGVPRRR